MEVSKAPCSHGCLGFMGPWALFEQILCAPALASEPNLVCDGILGSHRSDSRPIWRLHGPLWVAFQARLETGHMLALFCALFGSQGSYEAFFARLVQPVTSRIADKRGPPILSPKQTILPLGEQSGLNAS